MESDKPIYEFGDFHLDLGEKQLRRASGEVITIPPKAFELLVILVENPQHLLEKTELMDKVWADSFVEEGNLKIHVHTLRKVLNENGTEYIETIPRRGYRFSAPVRDLRDGDLVVEKITESRLVIEQNLPNSSPSRRRLALAFLLPALVLVAGAFLYFEVIRPRTNVAAVASVKSPASIAVLPFKNLTQDGRDEFLGVGLADNLIMRLSGLRDLAVRPTSSVLKLSGTAEESAEKLRVDNLVEGTIQRVGDRLRISVQLIQTKDQKILWAKTFDEAGIDLIKTQDSIAGEVARSLFADLAIADSTAITKRETSDPKAYEAYLKGRFFWNKRTVEDLSRAVGYFDQATQIDPQFSLAYAGLADAYQLLAEYGGIDPIQAITKARAASGKALSLNEASAEAHSSLGYTLAFFEWNFRDAEAEFKRAIELNPNYPTARQWYCEYLIVYGRFDEAMVEIRKAEELDPTSPIIQTDIAAIYYLSRQNDKAIEQAKKTLEIDPKFAYAYAYQWIAYEQSGQIDKAYESIIALDGVLYPPENIAQEREAYNGGGWGGLWQWKYDRCDQLGYKQFWTDYVRAMAALRLGKTDEVFEYLRGSYQKHERWFINLNTDPQWDPIRKDPRYAEIESLVSR